MLEKLILWLQTNNAQCKIKNDWGFDCIGCGCQRAFIELLKGNVLESIELYPALIPLLSLVVFFFIQLKVKIAYSNVIQKILLVLWLLVLIINYIIKLSNIL